MRALQTKDFWAGAFYIAVGLAAVWIARSYHFGTAGRMGAGYLPAVLGWLLAGLGLISLARAFVAKGELVGAIALKPAILIIGASLLFGVLANRAGLPIAIAVLAVTSAAASRHFRLEPRALLGLAALAAACVLVFVWGLGVPIPVLGSWFTDIGLVN